MVEVVALQARRDERWNHHLDREWGIPLEALDLSALDDSALAPAAEPASERARSTPRTRRRR
jgi:hypothetical protein